MGSVQRQSYLGTAGSSKDDKGAIEKTATEYYLVRFDDPASAVLAQLAVPVDVHPDNPALKFKSSSVKLVDDSTLREWQVQVDFSSSAKDTQPDNPLSRPALYSWTFDPANVPYFRDVDGNPVVNSAGEPFEELLEREYTNVCGQIKVNVGPNSSAEDLFDYKNAINRGSWEFDGVSIADGQAKFAGAELSEIKQENDVYYREFTVKFKFKAPSWDDQIEDRGYYQLDTAGKLVPIVKGTPPLKVVKPYPLDGTGKPKPLPTDKPATRKFKPYDRMDFSVFDYNR